MRPHGGIFAASAPWLVSAIMGELLRVGEPAPWFIAPCIGGNKRFAFESIGGSYVVMLFYGDASRPPCVEALALVDRHRHLFDDQQACFFGVSLRPEDAAQGRVTQQLPGIRHFLDADRAVSRNFGVMFPSDKGEVHRPCWMLLDQSLRLVEYRPLDQGAALFARLAALLGEEAQWRAEATAPVLIVPRVFEPALCRRLIEAYDNGEQRDSGYMVERDGKTVGIVNYKHKRRTDCTLEDMGLRDLIAMRIQTSIVPMIKRAYQFDVTRIERWIVACYDAGVGGHFRPHRDNTTGGTAHRKFACSINLNSEEFEGGGVRFPEFGPRVYRPPTGGAVIFSCSLLHEALPVTAGRRYAFLPFFYDEAAVAVRRENNAMLGANVTPYIGGQSAAAPDRRESAQPQPAA